VNNRQTTHRGFWEHATCGSGRMTAYPEVIPKQGSVRIGDHPAGTDNLGDKLQTRGAETTSRQS
jgi:hypothetical protein